MYNFLRKDSLKGDIFGGITSAIVALPLALAFGVSSGAGALAGLYGAIFTGFFAAIFGGTKTQITGPTGPMTVVMAIVITHFADNLAVAFSIVILSGIFQIILGVIGIGRYIKFVPHPVVSGFMSGIGVIIILLQLAPVLGHNNIMGSLMTKMSAIDDFIIQIDWKSVVLTGLTLIVILFTPKRIRNYFPPALLAIIIGSVCGYYFFPGVLIIGDIPSALPTLYIPQFPLERLPEIIKFSLMLGFLGAIDSLLTSLVADNLTHTQHDSNKELVGQGIGNIVSGLFGGLAGAGATMRTLVNIRSGGTTPLSGALHSVVLVLIILVFSDIARFIPLAVLAGILIKVGIDIIDWAAIKTINRAPKDGVFIMLTTLIITVAVDLVIAVAMGFVIACVLFVKRMAQVQSEKFRIIHDLTEFKTLPQIREEELHILEQAQGRIAISYLSGPLSFGSIRDIATRLKSSPPAKIVFIDMSAIPFIDSSASFILEEVIQQFKQSERELLLIAPNEDVLNTLSQTQVLSKIGEKNVFSSLLAGLRATTNLLQKNKVSTQ